MGGVLGVRLPTDTLSRDNIGHCDWSGNRFREPRRDSSSVSEHSNTYLGRAAAEVVIEAEAKAEVKVGVKVSVVVEVKVGNTHNRFS